MTILKSNKNQNQKNICLIKRMLFLYILTFGLVLSGCFSLVSHFEPIVESVGEDLREAYLSGQIDSGLIRVPEGASVYHIESSEDLFFAIQEELYLFNDTLYFQIESIDLFNDFWEKLTNKNVLHSAFQNVDVYLEYNKSSPTIVVMQSEFNVTGLLLKHYYNDSLSEIEMEEAISLLKVVEDILDEVIDSNNSDREIAIAIHDYIVRNSVYNLDESRPELATAYGVLVLNEGQCQGYSEAYALLMNIAGIETRVISGLALDQYAQYQPHAWNQVLIDDVWYHVDVTWNDPVPDLGDEVLHEFLLRSDSHFQRQHRWSHLFPECPIDDPIV